MVDRGVLLLDQFFRQAGEGGVFVGAVVVKNILGVLLGVIQFGPAAQIAEFAADRAGVAGGGGLAGVEADEGLLQLDVVQLDAGVLVESGVVGGEAVSGLKSAAGLLGIALDQGSCCPDRKIRAPPRCGPGAGCIRF